MLALPPKIIFEGIKAMRPQPHMPWLTPDFEEKFREAFGREMRLEEREFFGIKHNDHEVCEDNASAPQLLLFSGCR